MNPLISDPQTAYRMVQQQIDERVGEAALRRTAASTKRARPPAPSAEPRRAWLIWAPRRARI